MNLLKNKTAILTGATGMLGSCLAKTLMAAGVNLVLQYNSSDTRAVGLMDFSKKSRVKAAALKLNMLKEETPSVLMNRAISLTGRIDYLINSASIYKSSTLADMTTADIIEAVSVNAAAPLMLSRAFKNQCKTGVIVNILDARMVDYDKNHVAYSLSKQMLFSLTRMMSVEFAPDIRVNAIAPGIVTIPEGTPEDTVARMKAATLLKKTGTGENVVSALIYLLSNSFVTGETLFVDGGRNLNGRMFGL